jgi:multidrug efflux system membrane fusion protein
MNRRWANAAWILSALLAACSRQNGPGQGAPRAPMAASVTVATAERGMVPVTIRSVGNVEPISDVMLRPQVWGRVEEIPVQEGADVQAGDTLIVLDERPWDAALKETQAHTMRDRALAGEDRRVANQFRAALASNAAKQQELEAAEAKAAASDAQVLADEAAERTAALNLDYCRIKAPFAGRLGPLLVKMGAIVKINETDLVDLAQLKPIEVGFAVPERYVEAIRSGQARSPLPVTASISGDQPAAVAGTLSFIDNRVDTTTGTIRLKGRFANDEQRLWPGHFVDVVVTLTEEEGVIVPAAAVQASQKGQAIWVVKGDQTAELRPVRVRRQFEGKAVIDSGVSAGETVVTDGQLRLAPGAKVEIKPTAARPAGLLDEGAQEGAF